MQNHRRNNQIAKHRGRLDIIADILDVMNGPTKKTRIMYKANLSFTQLGQYLNSMVEYGLILREKDGGNSEVYKKTDKGVEFYKRYSELINLISEN